MIAEPSVAVHLRALDPFDFLTRAAFVYPSRIAVIDGDAWRTYPEFLERVRRLGGALQGLGIRNGERVAVLAPTPACCSRRPSPSGCRRHPVRAQYAPRPEEIDYILGHCGADLLLYDGELDPLVDRLTTPIRAFAPPRPARRDLAGTVGYEDCSTPHGPAT